MHMAHGDSETRPGLPPVFHQLHLRKPIDHRADGVHDSVAALGASRRDPQFQLRPQPGGDFQRGAGCAHEVLQRPGGSKCADAQRPAAEERPGNQRLRFQVIQIRQVRAGGLIRSPQPSAEPATVAGNVKIERPPLDIQALPKQFHAVGIRLEEANVGMTVHRKTGIRVIRRHTLPFLRGNPRRGCDDMGYRRIQARSQIRRIDNGPDLRRYAICPQGLGGVQCRHAQSDVADVLAGREILVREYYARR